MGADIETKTTLRRSNKGELTLPQKPATREEGREVTANTFVPTFRDALSKLEDEGVRNIIQNGLAEAFSTNDAGQRSDILKAANEYLSKSGEAQDLARLKLLGAIFSKDSTKLDMVRGLAQVGGIPHDELTYLAQALRDVSSALERGNIRDARSFFSQGGSSLALTAGDAAVAIHGHRVTSPDAQTFLRAHAAAMSALPEESRTAFMGAIAELGVAEIGGHAQQFLTEIKKFSTALGNKKLSTEEKRSILANISTAAASDPEDRAEHLTRFTAHYGGLSKQSLEEVWVGKASAFKLMLDHAPALEKAIETKTLNQFLGTVR